MRLRERLASEEHGEGRLIYRGSWGGVGELAGREVGQLSERVKRGVGFVETELLWRGCEDD